MEVIDVQKEHLSEVEILGHNALFTELRVDKSIIPDGINCYELRHGDDDSYPLALEEQVRVNYFGAVLMADKMMLGTEGRLTLEYEDFGFTGEELDAEEYLVNYGSTEVEDLSTQEELWKCIDKANVQLNMTEKEKDVLLGYMDGHGYMLGVVNGHLYRGDLCYDDDMIRWEKYSIDDAINAACEWNYEMIQEAKPQRENPEDFLDFVKKDSHYQTLREDEKILDRMFDRTRYGKEVMELAEKLADKAIQNLEKEGMEEAAQSVSEGIAQYGTDKKGRVR